MQIEANLGYKDAGKGVLLPEYLVRMTHREVMALGANRFEIGEQLSVIHCLNGIESHIRTLNSITNDLQRQNQNDLAQKLALAIMNESPRKDIEAIAASFLNGAFAKVIK